MLRAMAHRAERIMRLYGHYGWCAGVNLAEKFLRGNANVTSLLPMAFRQYRHADGSWKGW